jgi:hypothetical protein
MRDGSVLLVCGRVSSSAGAMVRGTLAGNGGRMAETQQELKAEIAKGEKGSTTKKGQRERASRSKAAHKDGAERLRWAADRRVGKNSEKLADLLTNNALKGDLASTKVLLALAEGKKPVPEVRKPGRSLALRLAAEPQWVAPREEGLRD